MPEPGLWELFRERVRRALEGKSKSGVREARSAGLPRTAISSVLRGHEPRLSRAAAIARALGFRIRLEPDDGSDGTFPEMDLQQVEACARALNQAVLAAGGNPFPPGVVVQEIRAAPKPTSTDPE